MARGDGFQPYDCPRCGEPAASPDGHHRCGQSDDDPTGKMLAKIRKLLALAEGTSYEEEAAAAWSKAQALMQRYAIDEALLRQQDRRGRREEVISRVIPLAANQKRRARKLELLRYVATASRVRVIDDRHTLPRHLHLGMPDRDKLTNERLNKMRGVAYLVGLESDVTFVELLWMSTLMQAWRFMSAAFKEHGVTNTKGAWGSSFLAGFNSRVARRLTEQNREEEVNAQKRVDDRTVTANDGAIVPVSVALALREVRELVDAKVHELFPNLGQGRGASGGTDPQGFAAGHAAGDRADLTGGRRGLAKQQGRLKEATR